MLNANIRYRFKLSNLISLLPFLVLILIYYCASELRHSNNPDDKLLPTVSELVYGVKQATFVTDRNGDIELKIDTLASLKRIAISLIFIAFGVIIGLYIGYIDIIDKLFYPFLLFFDKIPALALLPILFIVTGLGEVTKISLIVIGVAPTIILDTYLRVKSIPREQIVKAMTLNATQTQIIFKIILPIIFPNVLNTIRLNFKAIILFLIAGESLAATVGLGYRIFLVRRYLAMDTIIPYVLWLSLLAFMVDWGIRVWIRKRYVWLNMEQ